MAVCGDNPNARFLRKSQNEGERALYQNYWKEVTALYGSVIDYFVYDYALSAHDFFYGEHPLAPFRVPPKTFPMLPEFQNDSLLLSKFGIQTESDVVFIIPIQTFYEQFGNGEEPKADDLIRMTELGWDRPGGPNDINIADVAPVTACGDETDPLAKLCAGGIVDPVEVDCTLDDRSLSGYDDPTTFNDLVRGAPVYEITERRDENLTLHYNPLQGHYVWILHAKRFDYSYQPNAPREPGSDPVQDDTVSGLVSSISGNFGWPPVSSLPMPEDIKQDDNIQDESNEEWDYDDNAGSDDDVYGGY